MSQAVPPAPDDRASLRARFVAYVERLQLDICQALERADGRAVFGRDAWQRPGGGGGLTRVLAGGELLERAAVNVSAVHGTHEERMVAAMGPSLPGAAAAGAPAGGPATRFFAAGLSLIVHPRSPRVPIVHLNVRYLERDDDAWFGGGADLTPCYLDEADARHFHGVLKQAVAVAGDQAYPRFKAACDRYFWLKHRGEARGVGGVFFDHLRDDLAQGERLCQALGQAFLAAYLPIVERQRTAPWGERERRWQGLRRGRYVEFNLVWDRGTRFGLETDGRIESVLASLPPEARWEYAAEPEAGSPEAALLAVLRQPREWA